MTACLLVDCFWYYCLFWWTTTRMKPNPVVKGDLMFVINSCVTPCTLDIVHTPTIHSYSYHVLLPLLILHRIAMLEAY